MSGIKDAMCDVCGGRGCPECDGTGYERGAWDEYHPASHIEQTKETERQESKKKSWWGKVAGGAIGFAVGGPVGAAIGAAIGHGVDHIASEDKRIGTTPRRPEPFETQVAGVTYLNYDGSNRQQIISICHVGEHLLLIREPDNTHDSNAIRVCRTTGAQLGFIPKNITVNLAPAMDHGMTFMAVIVDIVGGQGYNYGCRIRIS